MVLPAGPERLKLAGIRDLSHQPNTRRELVVEASAAQLHAVVSVELDVKGWKRRIPYAQARLPLVFEVPEEMQPIAKDRAASGKRDLLVVDWHHSIQCGFFALNRLSRKLPRTEPDSMFVPRSCNRANLHAGRATECRIKSVRDVLELGDRVLAVRGCPPNPRSEDTC